MTRFWSHCLLFALAVFLTAPARTVAPSVVDILPLKAVVDLGDERQTLHIDCAVLDAEGHEDEYGDEETSRDDLAPPAEFSQLYEWALVGRGLDDAALPVLYLAWRSHADNARGPPGA